MYNLFLDDSRMPQSVYSYIKNSLYLTLDWEIVRSYEEFIKIIKEKGIPNIVSFDHDLADEHYIVDLPYDQYTEKTGYHCAKWLIEYCIEHKKDVPKTIFIHSMNNPGSRNIESLFMTYEKLYRGA